MWEAEQPDDAERVFGGRDAAEAAAAVVEEQVEPQEPEEDAGGPNHKPTHNTHVEVPKRTRLQDPCSWEVTEARHKPQVPHNPPKGLQYDKAHAFDTHEFLMMMN